MTVYLNNLGMVNPLGRDKVSIWESFTSNTGGLVLDDGFIKDKSVYVGKVRSQLETIPNNLSHFNNRNNQLLLTAFKQVEAAYQQLSSDVEANRIAIILGTSTGAMDDAEELLARLLKGESEDAYNFLNQEIGGGDHFLAEYLNLTDSLHYTVSTACSSSAKALVAAKRLIENDMADLVIAGGADSLCKLTLNGFDALESLSKAQCQPFSSERDGINIGEGAALFLMSKQASNIALSGAGETSDAYHMSAPDPEATGAINAMNQALLQANLTPDQVGYLNLHGTATVKNDEMEAKAIKTIFPEKCPVISSTKHLTGHMLGAAGVNEIAFCWLALTNEDAGLPMNQASISEEFSSLNFANAENCGTDKITHCMSNSFAFGGNNISLVISKEEGNG